MIEKNLGNIERVFRLLFGLAFAGWIVSQPELNGIAWFALVVSIMLILNGVFSRCYVWYIFDISTCSRNDKECIEDSTSCV